MLREIVANLKSISEMLRSGGLTPELRHLIADYLSPRPDSANDTGRTGGPLSQAFTDFGREGADLELLHNLRAALVLLGRIVKGDEGRELERLIEPAKRLDGIAAQLEWYFLPNAPFAESDEASTPPEMKCDELIPFAMRMSDPFAWRLLWDTHLKHLECRDRGHREEGDARALLREGKHEELAGNSISNAHQSQRTATIYRNQVQEVLTQLCGFENALRTHTPELLAHVPAINMSSRPTESEYRQYAAEMRRIEAGLRTHFRQGTMPQTETVSSAANEWQLLSHQFQHVPPVGLRWTERNDIAADSTFREQSDSPNVSQEFRMLAASAGKLLAPDDQWDGCATWYRHLIEEFSEAVELEHATPFSGSDGSEGIFAFRALPNAQARSAQAALRLASRQTDVTANTNHPTIRNALDVMARNRAAQQSAAAEREREELHQRDQLEAAWERIYVAAPVVGEPENYDAWVGNIVAFAQAMADAGHREAILSAQSPAEDERKALSLIQAAVTDGTEGVHRRIGELDAQQDDRIWKRVFNRSNLFWRILRPDRIDAIQTDTEKGAAGSSASQPEQPAAIQYVTLDQCAALVARTKRTLEKRKCRKENPFPPPDVKGGGGKPDEWNWDTIRPWLEQEFGRMLPQRHPSVRSTG